MQSKIIKYFSIFLTIIFFSNYSLADSKIDQAVDQTTDFLKSVSKRGLTKNQTAEFLNNYAITLKDERTDGEVTYIFNRENYKRYKDGLVISEDGWRYSKLGALRVFNGDIKLINAQLDHIKNNHLWHIERDVNRINKVVWVVGLMVFSNLLFLVRDILF